MIVIQKPIFSNYAPYYNGTPECHMFLTGQSQLTVCERKLSGIELVLFVKVDFHK